MASACKILMFIVVIIAHVFLATACAATQGGLQVYTYRRSLEERRLYSPPPPSPSQGTTTHP
ncbi:hypothetical protein IHE45_04G035500 [Dioscorea alata]|uniref:Uncharacterized protein n=1 Tax=Dioscorea alata TaxID=55571 RepID=A0ACB7WCC8_DIOAL|nr:hypothetical protein IHE45_04G035500 [Dioscorea alata]